MKKRCFNKYYALIILITTFMTSSLFASDELDKIHDNIKQKYDVEHIDNQTLTTMSSDKNVILFDVRKRKEYDVSHIENAIYVDPKISTDEFLALHADKLDDKVAVFYCSVGERSSLLLEKLKEELPATGVTDAYNLEGGAFKWHNDNISLVKDGEATRDIHPYNAYWGRLVTDKDAITYR